MIIQEKMSQEFTVTSLLDNSIRHIESAITAQYIFGSIKYRSTLAWLLGCGRIFIMPSLIQLPVEAGIVDLA